MEKHIIFLGFFLLASTLFSQIINIPQDYLTIQSGIDNATNGDTILVDEGIYFENINFKGKSIVVTSKYGISNNTDYILSTVIDGSNYDNLDTASCVVFVSGEDSTSVIQGFTLTGGKGTFYDLTNLNEPPYMGMTTHEGGGVFIAESAPTIRNNLIINNVASAGAGYDFHGGGGISSFLGNPKILNNVIMNNEALGSMGYAPGIVFNKSNGLIRNNILYENAGYAGGAIFIDMGVGATIVNNTIVENTSQTSYEAGLTIRGTNSVIINNIIWGNVQSSNQQIEGIANSIFEYNNSEQEFPAMPTIYSLNPGFSGTNLYLSTSSPCIDLGNPDEVYNDLEDQMNPGFALFPSLGEFRNDIGAYGGPYAKLNPEFLTTVIKKNENKAALNVFPNPANNIINVKASNINAEIIRISLINAIGIIIPFNTSNWDPSSTNQIDLGALPKGIYILNIQTENKTHSKKILIQ